MEVALNGPFGRVVLGSTPLTIGRTPDNQLVLADSKVSTHHAEIRPQGQDYALIDLGSTNGTFLNEQRLDAHVPRLLHATDLVLIGDTRFTYEVPGMFSDEPTVYAGFRQVSELGYPPSEASPSAPSIGYGSYIQPVEYAPGASYYGAPATSYGSDAQSAAYPPPPPSGGPEPSIYPPGSPSYGAPAPAPAQPRRQRGLWIILGAIVGTLVVTGLVTFAVIAYANRSTPTKTLNAFCNALKIGDYQVAYNQLSSGLQSKFGSEAQFVTGYSFNEGFGKITNCTVSNFNDSTGTGTLDNTFASGNTVVEDYTFVSENGAWKINGQQPRSTPTLTLHTYCQALKGDDFQTAYNQLSSTAQSQQSEAQFAANFSSGQTDCTVNQANDAVGTGTVTYTYSSGNKLTADYGLVNENGTWKINSQQLHSTPTLALLTYCSALRSGNYPTAYNQLSSSAQSQETEAQFAASYSYIVGLGKLTNCTVSRADDSTRTGTISYTFADGGTVIDDYILVNENSAWKLNSQQTRSTPTLTLLTYCGSLKHGNYPTAYNQLSSSLQSQVTEAQFASAFSTGKVTDCTVTNVDDAAGTGTISFTYANGSTRVFDFVLINENGTWKIQKGQARS